MENGWEKHARQADSMSKGPVVGGCRTCLMEWMKEEYSRKGSSIYCLTDLTSRSHAGMPLLPTGLPLAIGMVTQA